MIAKSQKRVKSALKKNRGGSQGQQATLSETKDRIGAVKNDVCRLKKSDRTGGTLDVHKASLSERSRRSNAQVSYTQLLIQLEGDDDSLVLGDVAMGDDDNNSAFSDKDEDMGDR